MNLNQLRYFLDAVKYRSISKAAEENFITQSAFSSSIIKLEEELMCQLLVRTNKGVFPTEIGEKVFYKIQEILNHIDEIKLMTNQVELSIDLCISGLPSLVDTLLTDTILDIEVNGHNIKVDVMTDETSNIVRAISSGRADMGLIFSDADYNFPKMQYEYLFSSHYVLFVGKSNSYFTKSQITMAEALRLKHIGYKSEYIKDDNYLTHLTRNYGSPKISLTVDNNESMRRIISDGDYAAFFPYFLCQGDPYISCCKIKALEIKDVVLPIDVGCIYSQKYTKKNKIEAFIAILKTNIAKHQYSDK